MVYRQIPTDQSLMLTMPKQQAILDYLARIGYDEFPEFIRDVLVKVEGHTPVDITDGPGDEKQDILTIARDGRRCLTQCKHTTNVNSHYNGDDLDLLVAACLRKDCRNAFFVTNGDLTPQGKKYVTDEEYMRGWPLKEDPIKIDYWNNLKLWDKIQGNADIMHKWFAGLGQTHGLRSFKFDLSVQKLPFNSSDSSQLGELIEQLKMLGVVQEVVNRLHYEANIEPGIKVNVKQWFQLSGEIDINYLPPGDDHEFAYKALYSLTVEVVITTTERYTPKQMRENAVRFLLENILTDLPEGQWWHILVSQSTGFIYLHDIGEPRKLVVDSAETFVKVGANPICYEREYCTLGKDFSIKATEEDDDDIYYHTASECQVVQLFDQRIHPVMEYNYQIIQQHQLSNLVDYTFRAVDKIDAGMMMRVRRMLPLNWIAFQQNNDALLWSFPPDTDNEQIELTERKLEVMGIKVLHVRDEDRERILKDVHKGIGPARFFIHGEMDRLSFPVDLKGRIFWISKYLQMDQLIGEEQAMELVKFKFAYENEHGYDNMRGETTLHTHSSELPEILFDIKTFRGSRTLDVAILKNPVWISIRFSSRETKSSDPLAKEAVAHFMQCYREIEALLNKGEVTKN